MTWFRDPREARRYRRRERRRELRDRLEGYLSSWNTLRQLYHSTFREQHIPGVPGVALNAFRHLSRPGRSVGEAVGELAGTYYGGPGGGYIGGVVGSKAGDLVDEYVLDNWSPISAGTEYSDLPLEAYDDAYNALTDAEKREFHGYSNKMPWNGLANRAHKRVSYKKAGKLRGNKKDVYVPKKLRKQVKEVIQDEKAHGALYLREQMCIGFYTTQGVPGGLTNGEVKTTINDLADQYITLALPRESNLMQQWWGTGTIGGGPTGIITNNAVYNYRNWVYFTPKQFLDAASQLFNNKPVSPDYMEDTGDIVTVVQEGVGQKTIFDQQGLELEIENSYVVYEMRNCAERPMIVDFYHCVQKEKFHENTPLNDYIDSVETGGWVDSNVNPQTASNRVYLPPDVNGNTLTNNAVKHYILGTSLVEPNQIQGFSNLWKYTKVTVLMQPGEVCTHKVMGPRNYILDYRKLYTGGEDNSRALFRDTTVCVMAKVRTDFMYGTAGVVPTAPDISVVGRGAFTINNKQDALTQPITINATTVIKMKCPDVAGFVPDNNQTDPQPLNMRVPRKVFIDTSNYRKAELAYKFSNEENPLNVKDQTQVDIFG